MTNRDDRTEEREGGGGEKKKTMAHRCTFARSIYHLIPRVVERSTSAFTLPQVERVHPPSLLSRRKRAREEEIGPREYVTTGTVHTIKCKRKKEKKKKGLVAGWLAGSTILVWMTANDFPPRFPVADSRGLWPKCRLTRAY